MTSLTGRDGPREARLRAIAGVDGPASPVHVVMALSNPFTRDPRVYNEARSLVRAGHDVTLIAWDREGTHRATEEVKGIRVVRLGHTPWMRAMGFDLFRLRGWWRAIERQATMIHGAHPIDVMHCHDLDTLPAGVRLKRRLGVRLVYDAHEIFGHMVARDLPAVIGSYFLSLERRLAPQANQILIENTVMRDYMRGLVGDRVPVDIVMNAKDVPVGPYQPEPAGPPGARLRVLYIGTLNESRFLLGTVEALRDLDGVELVIGGLGKPGYVERLREACQASDNARFIGPVDPGDVIPMTRDAHVVLCLTDPQDPNNRIATANKQFEAMAAGRPIITSEGTFLADFTLEHGLGVAVSHTRSGIRRGIVDLRDDQAGRIRFGKAALAAGQTRFNWGEQERVLRAVYERLAYGEGSV